MTNSLRNTVFNKTLDFSADFPYFFTILLIQKDKFLLSNLYMKIYCISHPQNKKNIKVLHEMLKTMFQKLYFALGLPNKGNNQ